ncbi:aldo/keto reductase [Arenicella sp.]|nr:aldo/keto reductase [Arenicella sp.]
MQKNLPSQSSDGSAVGVNLNPQKECDVRRRRLLQLSIGLSVFGSSSLSFAADDIIAKRPIPGTDEMLPVVGLGTSDEFNTTSTQEMAELGEVLRLLLSNGATLVDTAPSYGNSESVLGQLFESLSITDEIFVSTKVRSRGKQDGLAQMEESQSLLAKRPLDLMMVHSLFDADTQLQNLREWQEQGRVRYIGVTHHRTSEQPELEKYVATQEMDFLQCNYSVLEPEAENRLLPLAADQGLAVMINRPFQNGEYFSKVKGKDLPEWAAEFDCESWAQFTLKYILSNPHVTCVIPATSSPKHLVDNVRAGMGRLPDQAMRKRMREYILTI